MFLQLLPHLRGQRRHTTRKESRVRLLVEALPGQARARATAFARTLPRPASGTGTRDPPPDPASRSTHSPSCHLRNTSNASDCERFTCARPPLLLTKTTFGSIMNFRHAASSRCVKTSCVASRNARAHGASKAFGIGESNGTRRSAISSSEGRSWGISRGPAGELAMSVGGLSGSRRVSSRRKRAPTGLEPRNRRKCALLRVRDVCQAAANGRRRV